MPGSRLHLIVNMHSSGQHPSSWRLDHVNPRAFVDLDFYRETAAVAERGLFDAVFLADFSALQPETVRQPRWTMDPLVTLSALAAATDHVGLVVTISSTLNQPYQVARAIASLDHISNGRAGWNVVTSFDPNAGRNYGLDGLPDKVDRYRRAEEHIEVVEELWASWDDGALVLDAETGVFADLDRVPPIDHHGEFFDVAGPLQVPTPPQGRPVIFQSGSSEGGRTTAGRFADAVFTSQLTVDGARSYREDLQLRAEKSGREPGSVKVLPGVVVVAGATEEEALAKRRYLDDLSGGRAARIELVERLMHIDLTGADLDRPLTPDELARAGDANDNLQTGFLQTVVDYFRDGTKTIADFLDRASVGHRTLIGSPTQIADDFEEWLDEEAADGFVLMFDVLPDGLRDFVDLVVPELQRRGRYRTSYDTGTLAEHLGVDRPAPAPAG